MSIDRKNILTSEFGRIPPIISESVAKLAKSERNLIAILIRRNISIDSEQKENKHTHMSS